MSDDPFRSLGLAPTASADEVRAARRRLAKRHHPDHGGDADQMRAVNAAAAAALRKISEPAAATTEPTAAERAATTTDPVRSPRDRRSGWSSVARDVPSFTVEALPVETFEALSIVAAWMGEVLDDDPPYRLDVHLHEPVPCWCRLDVVPDAGASTVSLTLGTLDEDPLPAVEAVRDLWVAALNSLNWDEHAG